MKQALVVMLALLTAGCAVKVEGNTITSVYEYCAAHRGVDFYSTDTSTGMCNNGKRFVVEQGVLKEY